MPYRPVYLWERLDLLCLELYGEVTDALLQTLLLDNPALSGDTLPYMPRDGYRLYYRAADTLTAAPAPTYTPPDAELAALYQALDGGF